MQKERARVHLALQMSLPSALNPNSAHTSPPASEQPQQDHGTPTADTANEVIRKIDGATGAVSLVAGQYLVPGDTDGIGSAAKLNGPTGIRFDAGMLYCECRSAVGV